MTRITLYTGNGVSLSPVYAEGRVESSCVRLVADEGKALQKGNVVSPCVDVLISDAENWSEIDAPAEDEDISPEEAIDILLGGAT